MKNNEHLISKLVKNANFSNLKKGRKCCASLDFLNF